jgi:hypothetical protein
MLSKRFAILAALAMSPAFAQVPSAAISPLPTTISMRQAPMRLHQNLFNGSVKSDNWSGYAVGDSVFTHAQGSWIQPKADCTKTPNTYAAFWVGIDGFTSTTVEQTGTLIYCDGTTAEYYAWYEFYPSTPIEVISGITVKPGDKISADVSYANPDFTVTITDERTGKSFSKKSEVTGAKRSSAEWIAEAPESDGSIVPLTDFGTASYGEDYTDVNDTEWATGTTITGPISDFGSSVEKITMVSTADKDEAVPTALTTDGSSFKIAWKSE